MEKKKIEIEPIIIDPDQREREIMQSAIKEVFEGRFNDEPEVDEINLIDDFLAKQREKCQNVSTNAIEHTGREGGEEPRTFVTENINDTGNSRSLQRQEASRMHHITMPDKLESMQKDLLHCNFDGDLPEPSLEQLAELGVFDGDAGRKIFENIYDREKQNEIRRTDEELLPPLNNEIPGTSFNNQEVEIPLDNLNIDHHPKNIQQNDEQQQPEATTIPLVHEVDDSLANSSANQYTERLAIIARVDTDVDVNAVVQQPPKKRAKRRFQNRRENLLVRICSTTNFNKPLIVKTPKKIARMRKNPHTVAMFYRNEDLNIFESLESFVEYNLPPDDEINEIPEIEPVIFDCPQPVLSTTREEVTTPNNKRRIDSPTELEHSNKRAKSNSSNPINTLPPIFEISSAMPPIFETSTILPPIFETAMMPENNITEKAQQESINVQSMEIPLIDSHLYEHVARDPIILPPKPNPVPIAVNELLSERNDSQNPKLVPPSNPIHLINQSSIASAFDSFRKAKHIQPASLLKQVTEKDFEYSRLSNISKQIDGSASPQAQVRQSPTQLIKTATNQSTFAAEYREFKSKGIEYVEFYNKRKELIKLEEYNLENMALYMQVREYMREKGIWNANVQEMLDQGTFKLLHAIDNKQVLEHRLWRLCDDKFFIGTWSNNDLNLLEVEIPNNFTEYSTSDSENKENYP